LEKKNELEEIGIEIQNINLNEAMEIEDSQENLFSL